MAEFTGATLSLILVALLQTVGLAEKREASLIGETDRTEVEYEANWVELPLQALNKITDTTYAAGLVELGPFVWMFTLTNFSFLAAFLSLKFLLPSGSSTVTVGFSAILGTLWVFLPIMVVSEYSSFADEGIHPKSLEIHISYTLLSMFFLLLISAILLPDDVSKASDFIQSYKPIIGAFCLVLLFFWECFKVIKFRQTFEDELQCISGYEP